MIGERIGSYRVMRKLGEGAMGAVFEAVHEQIGRRAAIKILHAKFSVQPEFAKRFFNEARAVNIVQHSGLVGIYEVGQLPDGTAYIIMEYLEGDTLQGRLKAAGGKLGIEGLQLMRQIASALAATHAKNIIHRDLKPANVIIVPDPEAPGGERAKVLDFGVAKLNEPEALKEGEEPMTKSGTLFGTPTYMAPEQCRGAGTVDAKADVYSLGAMLYQVLGGRAPFVGGEGEVLGMHIFAKPRPLQELEPGLPEGLVQLVHQMLAKDPTERPTMTEVAQALGRFGAMSTGVWPAVGPLHLSGQVQQLPGAVMTASGMVLLPSAALPVVNSSKLPVVGGDGTAAGPSLASSYGSHETVTPSTMGEAHTPAAPRAGGPGARSRLALALGLGLPALGVIGLLSFRLVSAQAPRAEQRARQPAAQQRVHWSVVTVPAGAEVTMGDKLLGRTPLLYEQPAGTGSAALMLRKQGYTARRLELDLSRDMSVESMLQQEAPPEQQPDPKAEVKPDGKPDTGPGMRPDDHQGQGAHGTHGAKKVTSKVKRSKPAEDESDDGIPVFK